MGNNLSGASKDLSGAFYSEEERLAVIWDALAILIQGNLGIDILMPPLSFKDILTDTLDDDTGVWNWDGLFEVDDKDGVPIATGVWLATGTQEGREGIVTNVTVEKWEDIADELPKWKVENPEVLG